MDGVNAGLDVLDFGDGKGGVFVAQARGALADVDEPVLSRLTRGLSRTPRTRVKMAALAPMPSARVRITMTANPGVRRREWIATLRSRKKDMALAPFGDYPQNACQ